MKVRSIFLGLLAAGALASWCPPASAAEVRHIGVRLFYEASGTLSEDVTNDPNFRGWNTGLGEGSAKEPATDFLVTIDLVGQPDTYDRSDVAVEVSDRTGRTIRHVISGILFGRSGVAHKAILAHDMVCSPVTIRAESAGQVSTATVNFRCGE